MWRVDTDAGAVLAEWLRVTRPDGRLSLSVPGPRELTPTAIYGEIYERNVGMKTPLKLERGLNGLWTNGGLMYAPPVR